MAEKEYTVVAPDGKEITLIGPVGASQEEVIAQAQQLYKPQTISPSAQFGETGGGAATGKPLLINRTNVQTEPRPLESAMAGFTKSMMDVPVAASQLATGGNLGTSELAQKLGQQASAYQEANPISYGAGRVGGMIPPAIAGGGAIGAIPSFAKMGALGQNVALGAASGALTPQETGKTGQELYAEQLKQGAIGGGIGALLTPVQKLAGVLRGPEQPAQMAGAVEKAREAGYVIPPTQARGDIANRLMEGIAGKATTAQNASAKNQEITHKLVAQSLGLPEGEVILPEVLKDLRQTAGQAYAKLENIGRKFLKFQ